MGPKPGGRAAAAIRSGAATVQDFWQPRGASYQNTVAVRGDLCCEGVTTLFLVWPL